MPDPHDELADEPVDEPVAVTDADDVGRLVPLIRALDGTWKEGETLDQLAIRWTPHLVRPDKKWALHIHLSLGAPSYITRRLAAAAADGHLVHVALRLEAMYDSEVLDLLGATDAYVYVINDDGEPTPRRHYLAALADLGVAVEPKTRRRLAKAAWDRIKDGTENQRGRRLEALLAFLLAQVTDFRIFERNFRTDTGEIDVVLQIDNFSTRCWSEPGVPFVYAESKNTADPAGSPIVAIFIRRLQTSRQRVRLGLLFSVGGFTSDAEREELRLSEGPLCIAFFDADAIGAMIDSQDLDSMLDAHIGKAMLR